MKWLALSILLLASCGGGPRGRVATAVDAGDLEGALAAYEDYRGSEGADADVLGRVAALLLEEEARAQPPLHPAEHPTPRRGASCSG